VKTGLLTGLLTGKQGWKYPVSVLDEVDFFDESLSSLSRLG
jgi:hypothetical protein